MSKTHFGELAVYERMNINPLKTSNYYMYHPL
jgi:hypothetical protein